LHVEACTTCHGKGKGASYMLQSYQAGAVELVMTKTMQCSGGISLALTKTLLV
jgi:hypothetical protein